MCSRRLRLVCLFGLISACVPQFAQATEVGDLREQIAVELRPRTPQEFAFLDRVILLVEQDQLPLVLVQEMFQWARGKQPYPFTYFQRGLVERAAREGYSLQKKPAEKGLLAGLLDSLPSLRLRLRSLGR